MSLVDICGSYPNTDQRVSVLKLTSKDCIGSKPSLTMGPASVDQPTQMGKIKKKIASVLDMSWPRFLVLSSVALESRGERVPEVLAFLWLGLLHVKQHPLNSPRLLW